MVHSPLAARGAIRSPLATGSGGAATVWTDPIAGDVVYIPAFQHPDVPGVTFGGFVVQQYAASQPNATDSDDNPDVADGAAVGAVPAHSKRMVSPWREITMLNARRACANIGTGWHLITDFEWASLAMYAHKMSTQPHGPNANTNPPSDIEYPAETGVLDAALFARGTVHKSALTGSGPNTWAHNHAADGVFDLNGVIWQWTAGTMLCPANLNDNSDTPVAITGAGGKGYTLVSANLVVTLPGSPYGASTSVAAHTLTDSNKAWAVDAFAGCYLFDAAGALYRITANSATTLTIDKAAGPAAGPYNIFKLVETDITAGMTNGHKILTLQSGADLAPLAVPVTADTSGAAAYGNDYYYYSVAALRASLRGGCWTYSVGAGVFALVLSRAPSSRHVSFGCRACKAL